MKKVMVIMLLSTAITDLRAMRHHQRYSYRVEEGQPSCIDCLPVFFGCIAQETPRAVSSVYHRIKECLRERFAPRQRTIRRSRARLDLNRNSYTYTTYTTQDDCEMDSLGEANKVE